MLKPSKTVIYSPPPLSIGANVTEAFHYIHLGDAPRALRALCPAIENTARRESGYGSGNKHFKRWVKDHTPLAVLAATSGKLYCEHLRIAYSHPAIKTDDGACGLDELMYHIFRCELAHNGELPPDIKWSNDSFVGQPQGGGDMILPLDILTGYAAGVVGAKCNASQRLEMDVLISAMRGDIELQKYWGRKSEILNMLSGGDDRGAIARRHAAERLLFKQSGPSPTNGPAANTK